MVFLIDAHRPNVRQDREFLKRTRHCIEGTWGAQVIDDLAGVTLASASTLESSVTADGTKSDNAAKVGAAIAERAKAAGIQAVVFDRGGFQYHGRVAALASAAREAGLEF